MSITALLCSLLAVFTTHFDYERPRPPNIWICHNLVCHTNERETLKTCLTNHKETITRHYLLILCLGGGHRHTYCTEILYLDGGFEPGITIPSAKGWFTTNITVCLRFYQFIHRRLLVLTEVGRLLMETTVHALLSSA